jgi:transposase
MRQDEGKVLQEQASSGRIETSPRNPGECGFSLTGEYVADNDEQAIAITHGYSKDHRPDLKQAVLELMVSQDRGVPFMRQSWDGNTSDTQIFQERAVALIATFQRFPTPRYVVADSKLYTEGNATNLQSLGFITRIPHTLKLVS